jgi:hypothetical protein
MGDETSNEREWGTVKVVESNEEAILVAGYLNSNGIPAEVESLHVEELPVNLGGLGEVRVRVPADRLAEAQALLDASEAGSASDPGNAGDAGGADDAADAGGQAERGDPDE